MADVVGVIFQNGIKTYYFDPAGLELARGDRVVVQTMRGSEIGQVVDPPHTIDDSELPAPLKKVTRVATGKDLESLAASESLRREAMATCRRLVEEHGLDMKLVGADIVFGGEKITFSFYSEERVDFRTLVADLAKALKMRIELRQIGAREEARMIGGLGPCGRHLCCTLFPGDEDPVSIRMAKEQNLPLNPMKISGLCGRLMCCLKYEQEQYVAFRKEAPPRGTPVKTSTGEGVVTGYNVPKDSISVRFEDGTHADIRLADCQCEHRGGLITVTDTEEESFLEAGEGLFAADGARACPGTSLAVIEAALVTGEDGEAVEIILVEGDLPAVGSGGAARAAPGEARVEGDGLGRRSRSRGRGRRGRGRGQSAQAGGEGVAAGAGGQQGAGSSGGQGSGAAGPGGGGRGARPGGQGREGGGAPGQTGGSRGGGTAQGETAGTAGEASEGGGRSRSSRRRRRPRRPGEGGDGGSGSTGGAGGAQGGGAGGGGAGGTGD